MYFDPDTDGFLCGLFMFNVLNWSVVGFYDGKVLTLKKGEVSKNCIYLDMEIFRSYVKSLGHHMVLYNKRNKKEISRITGLTFQIVFNQTT